MGSGDSDTEFYTALTPDFVFRGKFAVGTLPGTGEGMLLGTFSPATWVHPGREEAGFHRSS